MTHVGDRVAVRDLETDTLLDVGYVSSTDTSHEILIDSDYNGATSYDTDTVYLAKPEDILIGELPTG